MKVYAEYYEYDVKKVIITDDEGHGLDVMMPDLGDNFGSFADFVVIAKDEKTMKKLDPFLKQMVEHMLEEETPDD